MKIGVQLAASTVFGTIGLGAIVFLPAGTLNYWQGWAFIVIFMVVTIIPTVFLARTNPAALRRRMHAGPRAEARMLQKFVVTGAFSSMFAMMAVSAYDHRVGWSQVPTWVCVLGDVLLAAGLGLAMLVVIQNGYAASTITVETGQTVVSTGVYRFVRHPMYFGDVIMMIGIPLSLSSYWGLVFVPLGVATLVSRILDEEKMLTQELSGYREYTQRVRYRLLPYVW
ncbi:MAG: isoprenylcysteine carboxylmethyltransferase family protein [Mycobacterium sp.]|uniref:methyltransferase family protein n=1 Tax=Mycobacterium sp. TaxID=1785 RepID=UPI003C4B984A